MYEIKNNYIAFIAFMASPYRWFWLVSLLVAGMTLRFIIIPAINEASCTKAVLNGNSDKVKKLLKHNGVNPNGMVSQGVTYLDYAAQVGNVQLAKVLLDHGAKIPQSAKDVSNLLHSAAKHGDMSTAQLLLKLGAGAGIPFPNGMQPLEWAVRNQSIEFINILINHGANPNLVAGAGQSLLALAVALDFPKIIDTLVNRGADINATVTTPVSEEFINLFTTQYERFFLTKDSGLTPLMLAIIRKRQDTVRTLLARKARMDIRTKKQRVWPLGLAANRQDVEMMQVLLGRDPDPAKQERHIIVSLSKQTATVYMKDKVALKTHVSTGRKGYATPPGKYVITNKHKKWTSTIYGASMPYFLRLNGSAIGLHQGIVPGRPASHGCVRVPSGTAARLFALMSIGDLVTIENH